MSLRVGDLRFVGHDRHDRRLEGRLVDLVDLDALVAEPLDEVRLGLVDLVGALRGGFLHHRLDRRCIVADPAIAPFETMMISELPIWPVRLMLDCTS